MDGPRDPVGLLSEAGDDPLVQRVYSPAMIKALGRLAAARESILKALEALPQTLCHGDVHTRNAFLRHGNNGPETVAIDWAFCGPGPVGSDLVMLVDGSLSWFEVDQADAEDLERRCLSGYLAGLHAAGWDGDALDVRYGYMGSLVLRALGGVGTAFTVLRDEGLHAVAEQAFGRPFEVLAENVRLTMAFLEPRIDVALQLADQ